MASTLPTSPTSLYRLRTRQRHPLPAHARDRSLLMPLSATAATSNVGSSSSANLALPTLRGHVQLNMRPQAGPHGLSDVDELGRPVVVGNSGMAGSSRDAQAAASTSTQATKKRRFDPSASTAPARPKIPPPPLDDKVDEDAEPAQEFNCPVCLCPPTTAVVTPCGHLMCFACLQKSLATNLIRSQQRPPAALVNSTGPPLTTAYNLEGDCPVCRKTLPGGLLGKKDRNGKVIAEGVRRIEVKLRDVRPVIELE